MVLYTRQVVDESSVNVALIIAIVIGVLIWGIVWGFATRMIIINKGYKENWFWWGFFFGLIAALVALSKPECVHQYDKRYFSGALSLAAEEKRLSQKAGAGEWKCDGCGRINPNYVGTCGCGNSKK